jgi:predicted TIM-barrel fold metal-dependent hydrolase
MQGEGLEGQGEPILEPELPIIDPHHHLWFVPEAVRAAMDAETNPYFHVRRRRPRYLFDELLDDLRTGHNVRATMFVECHSMYRPFGPERFRPLGEVEFVNGFAAMGASRLFGDIQVCAGIIGHADLTLGDAVVEVLQASVNIAGPRYRGVRHVSQHDPDPYFARIGGATPPGLLLDPRFRDGFKQLERMGLAFDAFLYEPQLPEVLDLAREFPGTTIVLNHTGTPSRSGATTFRRWRGARTSISSSAVSACRSAGSTRSWRRRRRRPSVWPKNGAPISKPESKHSAPRDACSRAISRPSQGAAPIQCFGTRSSAWPLAQPPMRSGSSSRASRKRPTTSL